MNALISLHQITKSYRNTRALDGVNLDIQSGITGLLGPNGAGKSTLIKVILGLVKVNSGSGLVLGHRLGSEGRAIRNRIGYMPEDDCYLPGMTGVEVVQFSAALSGLPIVEGLRRAHEILDFCGMKQERYRQIETYSTGMRQKIKFAAAIVHDPDYLIFDEPTSGLDPEERENLLNRIRILADDSGKSVLISTHILPDVQSICDQAVILAQGQIVLNETLVALNQPNAPTFCVRVRGDESQFVQCLGRLGLTAEQNVDLSWQVSGRAGDFSDDLWHAARETGATILTMEPAKNDLEAIFIQAVEESENANT
jgi:ABC-2 type transport system ATP-binding protein